MLTVLLLVHFTRRSIYSMPICLCSTSALQNAQQFLTTWSSSHTKVTEHKSAPSNR